MTDLSPAAQAVLDAFLADWQDEPVQQDRACLAAALEALADQAVPKTLIAFNKDYSAGAINEQIVIRNKILAIAAELKQ